MQEIRPTFADTWRFSLAIFWKFLAIIFLAMALLQFASWALSLGHVEYWGASIAYRLSSAIEVGWLTPEALWLCWAAFTTVVSLVAQFVVFNLLVAAHIGKRFKAVEVIIREAA